MSYVYNQSNSEILEVQITKSITVGRLCRINPSEAWMGIESGVIKIVGIEYYTEDVNEAILDMMSVHYEMHLDMFDPTEDDIYDEEKTRLLNEPWIAYEYQRNGELYVLPLAEFLDHAMMY